MGLFITFEGPDGAGKTTQLHALAADLTARGYTVFQTREPGGTVIGDEIRQVVHSLKHMEMASQAEILLYSASRAQLVYQELMPRLAQNQIVLCDRYADSTYAYQGYGRQLDFEALRFITQFATGGLIPDLTLLLDIDVAEGLKRRHAARQTGGEWNRLDQLAQEFHQRVYEGYHEMAQREPDRWRIINAMAPLEVVGQHIRQAIEPMLPRQV